MTETRTAVFTDNETGQEIEHTLPADYFRVCRFLAGMGFVTVHACYQSPPLRDYTCHLTGRYPHWWEGRRFRKPIR